MQATAAAPVLRPVPVLLPGREPSLPDLPDRLIEPIGRHLRRTLPPSRMFRIKQGLSAYRSQHPGSETFDASQGDGGASLGGIPRDELTAALHEFLPRSSTTAYGTPQGDRRVREMIFTRYWRLGSDIGLTPDHVVLAQGGRDALQKWYQATALMTGRAGDCLLTSAAPWISYAEGAYLAGLNLLCAPCDGTGFKITPDALDESLAFAREQELTVRALMITTPDNPTGTFYTQEEVTKLIAHAARCGITYIFLDLMYQAVLDPGFTRYNLGAILRALPSEVRTRVTAMDGLTKSAGASNVRHAHLVCGDKDLAEVVAAIASHTVLPCVLSEAAALAVYGSDDPDAHPWIRRIVEPTADSRALFRDLMTKLGHAFVADQGYYAFVDVSRWLGGSVRDSDELSAHLATEHGLAVVPGKPFYAPDFIRFSLAQHPHHTRGAVERLHAALRNLT